jgi:hypothetical protein
VIKIIYRNSTEMDGIPPIFYENLFTLILCVKINKGRPLFFREINPCRDKKKTIPECDDYEDELDEDEIAIRKIILFQLNKVSIYLDEIIAKFDSEKSFTLNPNGSNNIIDTLITLEKFGEYVRNLKFSQYNFLNENLIKQQEKKLHDEKDNNFEYDEIYLIKLATERMLYTYANLIINLNDCKTIKEKIILEGLNGFLVVENDELVLFAIYRFMARDDFHALHSQIKIHQEEDVRERRSKTEKKLETLKIIKIKNL